MEKQTEMTITCRPMGSEEFTEISFALERHHTLFYKLWALGRPVFDDRVPTAQVRFDKIGKCIMFEIGTAFWGTLSFVQKLFVICHEAKHVINNHGKRALDIKTAEDRRLANIAMDICVNEDLIARFGFQRDEIDPDDRWIWADKVAKELGLIGLETDCSFEYYYNLLKRHAPPNFGGGGGTEGAPGGGGGMETVDDHDALGGMSDADIEEVMKEIAESGLSEDEMRRIANALNDDKDKNERGCGNQALGQMFSIQPEVVKKKRKWETVIRKWISKAIRIVDRDTSQWIRTNRRMAAVVSDLMLPSDATNDIRAPDKHKIKVWFFLDTSGSCISYKHRFFRAARSIPEDKFDMRLLCFDTSVYSTTLKSGAVFGGGGTSIRNVESYILRETIAKGQKYPDAVFLITDADAPPVSPLYPERWYWFLTDKYYERNVPEKSHKFMLKDYE